MTYVYRAKTLLQYQSNTEATFSDLHLSISNDDVSTNIYDFDFETVNFLYLDGDVPRSTYGMNGENGWKGGIPILLLKRLRFGGS